MSSRFNIFFGLSLVFLMTAPIGCDHSDLSTLASFEGVNSAGQKVGLALVAIRNKPSVTLPVSDDVGVQQSEAIINTKLFALLECETGMLEKAEAAAAKDKLFIDADRDIAGAESCHIVGSRLMSWDVFVNAYQRAAVWPSTWPKDESSSQQLESEFVVMQALHLALTSQGVSPALTAGREQRGTVLDQNKVRSLITKLDPMFNPCESVVAGTPSYAAALKERYFSCVKRADGSLSYRVGGTRGADYESLRERLAGSIAEMHNAIFVTLPENNPQLEVLWDLVTSTRRFADAKDRGRELGRYLAGKESDEFDFLVEFGNAELNRIQPDVPLSLDLTSDYDLDAGAPQFGLTSVNLEEVLGILGIVAALVSRLPPPVQTVAAAPATQTTAQQTVFKPTTSTCTPCVASPVIKSAATKPAGTATPMAAQAKPQIAATPQPIVINNNFTPTNTITNNSNSGAALGASPAPTAQE